MAVLILGAAAGWVCEQVPVRPLARNIAAALLGWTIGSVGPMVLTLLVLTWWQQTQGSGGLGAVSAGFAEVTVFGIAAPVVLAITAWLASDRLAAIMPAVVGTHSSIFTGGACALVSALLTAPGIVVS